MNHEKADAFNEAKKHAGDQVKVTRPGHGEERDPGPRSQQRRGDVAGPARNGPESARGMSPQIPRAFFIREEVPPASCSSRWRGSRSGPPRFVEPERGGARASARRKTAASAAMGRKEWRARQPRRAGRTVPSYKALMMFATTEQDVREWIRDGVTAARAKSETWRANRDASALRMPAFGKRLKAREIDDLAAFVMAVSGEEAPKISRPRGARPRPRSWDAPDATGSTPVLAARIPARSRATFPRGTGRTSPSWFGIGKSSTSGWNAATRAGSKPTRSRCTSCDARRCICLPSSGSWRRAISMRSGRMCAGFGRGARLPRAGRLRPPGRIRTTSRLRPARHDQDLGKVEVELPLAGLRPERLDGARGRRLEPPSQLRFTESLTVCSPAHASKSRAFRKISLCSTLKPAPVKYRTHSVVVYARTWLGSRNFSNALM